MPPKKSDSESLDEKAKDKKVDDEKVSDEKPDVDNDDEEKDENANDEVAKDEKTKDGKSKDEKAKDEKPDEDEVPDEELSNCCWGPFKNKYRYAVLLLSVACLTSMSSNVIAINFTFICMTPPINATDPNNFVAPEGVPLYDYAQSDKSLFQWAVGGGSAVATFPFTYAYQKFGTRWIFLVSGLVSAVSTVTVPFAASMGKWWLFADRVLLGVTYSSNFAVIGHIVIKWATLTEVGFFLGLLTAFTSLSSVATNPISGILCACKYGWPIVYYSHAAVCFVLFCLWGIFYSDHPETHFAISGKELKTLHKNKTNARKYGSKSVPYFKIIRNPYVLVIWLNALADIGCIVFLSTYGPTFINKVLHYGVTKTGFIGALPAVLQVTCKLVTGFMSDKLNCVHERIKLIFFNTLSLFMAGVLYAILGFIPDDQPIIAVSVFIAIHGFLSANCGGFYKAATLVGQQHTAFIVSCIQFIKCLTLFIGPGLVWLFVKDDSSKSQWRIVFIILAVTLIGSNFVFCFVSTTEPAAFTYEKIEEVDEEEEAGNENAEEEKEEDSKKDSKKAVAKKASA
uniref:MFS domain-containing protein n=1 Tax=Panagrellus redivivus TaxID=6233 RepID=A0A7E4VHJ1_PANRE